MKVSQRKTNDMKVAKSNGATTNSGRNNSSSSSSTNGGSNKLTTTTTNNNNNNNISLINNLEQIDLTDDTNSIEDQISSLLNENVEHSNGDDDDEDGQIRTTTSKSFLLLDEQEHLHINSIDDLIKLLNYKQNDDRLVKCVCIFGNTGDGKSFTLNQTFFNGDNVFPTSDKQESCTVGIWCASCEFSGVNTLIFDTEGLLGVSDNENKRTRLLLKILAISDVIIYRSRADRLHNDLFKFLGDASVAYLKYFSKELKATSQKLKVDISAIGPHVVIFHETQHTECLKDEPTKPISTQINERFSKLNLSYDAFRSIEYVGTRTTRTTLATDFSKLKRKLTELLRNNAVRSPRKVSVIYQVLKVLNDKFNGNITQNQMSSFPDEYFTCSSECLACGKRCKNSINHLKDNILHETVDKCRYDHQYDNKVYVCKLCHEMGKEVIVVPKTCSSNENSLVGMVRYALSGFVLECPHHGIIYRSRQYWYGNKDPEIVVRTELKHIWSGQANHVGTSHNAARKLIDGVAYVSESLQSVSAKPTKIAFQWMADQIAPSYWIPNSEITNCYKCKKLFESFEKKHHCRGCGQGFCDKCSSKRKVIPWWSITEKVRVCDDCADKDHIPEPVPDVTARKVTETITGTLDLIGYATKIPLDALKESARPSYWKPDCECTKCYICKKEFNDLLPLHHCRSCGEGICSNCSPHLKPVPSRGWDHPVRICENCNLNSDTTKTSNNNINNE